MKWPDKFPHGMFAVNNTSTNFGYFIDKTTVKNDDRKT